MAKEFIIGLDFGTESLRGILIAADSGVAERRHIHPYRHGAMTRALPTGRKLPRDWALQHAPDYLDAAESVLDALGRNRHIVSIGIDFTASSPLPALLDGTPLSTLYPDDPHAYVKLWKHHAAQPWADRINETRHPFLAGSGGKTSSEWMLAKAWQIEEEAPALWERAERFIEAGDWVVWQLVGREARSKCHAGYKAHYRDDAGYPDLVPGLAAKLAPPLPIASRAGILTDAWRRRTGILGETVVAVAAIDAHAVLPAVGATEAGVVVGSLGTSACYMLLDGAARDIDGITGGVKDGAMPGVWCYEAGQAAFGDVLAWFVRTFPRGHNDADGFAYYNTAASQLSIGEHRPIALDWWNGCRAPLANSALSGAYVGMTLRTTAVDLYWSLLESLCFGARRILEIFGGGGTVIERVILTSGLAERNPLLMQMMADIGGREIEVPRIGHATATGAAIHGAVAAGVVRDFREGAARFGAREAVRYDPSLSVRAYYGERYGRYLEMSGDQILISTMNGLAAGDA